MKVETRKVTVEQNVYIAEDGKEFFSKLDCEIYDRRLIEESLKFYDTRFEESDLESCKYVNIQNATDLLNLISLCEFDGITTGGLANIGIYVYDHNSDRWINMSEAVTRIEAMQ